MGERMEVEVLDDCDECGGWADSPGCGRCGGNGKESVEFPVAPGSLTEARLRLADAAEALAHEESGDYEACAYVDALAALRTKRAGG